jgi:RimJ/RimL family protein N-acetyltransferase
VNISKKSKIVGPGVALRGVVESDADWIVRLRRQPHAIKYLGDTSADLSVQIEWLRRYFDRPNDLYFAIEEIKGGTPVGTIALYDIERGTAEWGRWVLQQNSIFAIPSALLIYQIAFEYLGLEKTYTRTLSDNKKVVAFHNSTGAEIVAVDEEFVQINGQKFGITRHEVKRECAKIVIDKLGRLAKCLAGRL